MNMQTSLEAFQMPSSVLTHTLKIFAGKVYYQLRVTSFAKFNHCQAILVNSSYIVTLAQFL